VFNFKHFFKGQLKVAKRTFTAEQDIVILNLFRRKKLDKLTNIFIVNEFAKQFNISKIAFETLSRRYNGIILIIIYNYIISNLKSINRFR